MPKSSGIRWGAWLFILAGILIYYFRPLQSCSWWNIFCMGASALVTPLFILFSVILIIVGIYKLIKREK